MLLTFVEDFTSDVQLDAVLLSTPETGFFLNSGVHPSVTINNLLHFLPNLDITIADWDNTKQYTKFLDSRKKSDIVTKNGVIYESRTSFGVVGGFTVPNLNIDPEGVNGAQFWLPTNLESLRLKFFICTSLDNAINQLSLNRRNIESQYLYNLNENYNQLTQLPGDYAGWVFEPRGSDYVKFRINQVALLAPGNTPVNISVINQKKLITTLSVTPDNGHLTWNEKNYVFGGTGIWKFVIPSQEVYTNGSYIDPFRFRSFVPYTITGLGVSPEVATYTESTTGMGLNFNITTYHDPSVYVDNNIIDFGAYLQAAFELDVLRMYLSNSHNSSNYVQRIQMDKNQLELETKEMNGFTSIYRFKKEKKRAIEKINNVMDLQLNAENDSGIRVTYSSV